MKIIDPVVGAKASNCASGLPENGATTRPPRVRPRGRLAPTAAAAMSTAPSRPRTALDPFERQANVPLAYDHVASADLYLAFAWYQNSPVKERRLRSVYESALKRLW